MPFEDSFASSLFIFQKNSFVDTSFVRWWNFDRKILISDTFVSMVSWIRHLDSQLRNEKASKTPEFSSGLIHI